MIPNFKKIILLSSLIHFLVIGSAFLNWQVFPSRPKPPTIYTVKVIELPEKKPKRGKSVKSLKKKSKPKKEKISLNQKRKKLEKIRKEWESKRKQELIEKEEEIKKLEAWSKKKERIKATLPSKSLSFFNIPDLPAWYINLIHDKVFENWSSPPGIEKETVTIFFEICKEGEIKSPLVKKSASVPLFNESCLDAVKKSAPFPPLPYQYRKNILRVYLTFKQEKSEK